MKRNLFTAVVLLSFVSLTFMSCEKIKDLTDIPIETTLDVDVPATSALATESSLKSNSEAGYPFDGSAIIEPTSDSDINKYKKKIRSWEVKKLTNRVKNIHTPATLIKGELVITDEETDDVLLKKEMTNLRLTTGVVVMELMGSDWTKVTDALGELHSLKVSFKGDLDKPGVVIVFGIGLDVKIIANPLN
jgi:hypothetical protein